MKIPKCQCNRYLLPWEGDTCGICQAIGCKSVTSKWEQDRMFYDHEMFPIEDWEFYRKEDISCGNGDPGEEIPDYVYDQCWEDAMDNWQACSNAISPTMEDGSVHLVDFVVFKQGSNRDWVKIVRWSDHPFDAVRKVIGSLDYLGEFYFCGDHLRVRIQATNFLVYPSVFQVKGYIDGKPINKEGWVHNGWLEKRIGWYPYKRNPSGEPVEWHEAEDAMDDMKDVEDWYQDRGKEFTWRLYLMAENPIELDIEVVYL